MIKHFGLDRQYKSLKDELLDSTNQVLQSGILMNGEFTNKFENWLINKTNATYAITVHSGTQALEIMARHYKQLNEKVYGDADVLNIKIPNISYIATLNAFLNAGWKVELVDTNNDGLIKIQEEYDELFSICSIGLYGAKPPNLRFNGSPEFIDGAQHWLIADDIGNGMAISFDPTKNLPSSGNGGAIVTHDKSLYEFATSYRSNGKSTYSMYGTNSRMSEQDCAQILVRTKYLNDWQERRKQIRYYYLDQLKNLPIRCLSRNHEVHADQKFVIYTDKRDKLMNFLTEKQIETKIHYDKALSEYPLAKHIKKPDMLSNSVMLTRGVLSLPIYPELTDSEIEYITTQVKNFFT